MKIYNEEEQAEQGKIFEEKGRTRKWNGAKSYVQGDKQIEKWNKRSGDLRAKLHPSKLKLVKKK